MFSIYLVPFLLLTLLTQRADQQAQNYETKTYWSEDNPKICSFLEKYIANVTSDLFLYYSRCNSTTRHEIKFKYWTDPAFEYHLKHLKYADLNDYKKYANQ